MTILVSIAIFALLPSIPFFFYLYLNRKHIKVDFSRHMIYGWYDGHILASARFNMRFTPNEILDIKQSVEKELDEMIEKYKQINK